MTPDEPAGCRGRARPGHGQPRPPGRRRRRHQVEHGQHPAPSRRALRPRPYPVMRPANQHGCTPPSGSALSLATEARLCRDQPAGRHRARSAARTSGAIATRAVDQAGGPRRPAVALVGTGISAPRTTRTPIRPAPYCGSSHQRLCYTSSREGGSALLCHRIDHQVTPPGGRSLSIGYPPRIDIAPR